MRICYVARFDYGQNDDEGAIAHALRVLGHDVTEVNERNAAGCPTDGFDLMLFHKMDDVPTLKRFEGKCPRAFWYFDLVDWPNDPAVSRRNESRKDWMRRVIPNVEFGFCTDGDWVHHWNDETKQMNADGFSFGYRPCLSVLRQGADERVVGYATADPYASPRILVVGGRSSSTGRADFIRDMQDKYGPMFRWIQNGVWGRRLAKEVANATLVVCPDSPVTGFYWSNRVYVLAGFGACLLHPYCHDLFPAEGRPRPGEYAEDEVDCYMDKTDLHKRIEELRHHPRAEDIRRSLQVGALEGTKERNLYRHRCEELIRRVSGNP